MDCHNMLIFMKLMKRTPNNGCLLLLVSAIGVLSPTAARALDYHVNSAQTLQNALTLAAASSVSNNIYVTNGYYTGNFNYNSTTSNYLTLLAEPGVSNNQITIDGGGTGASMNISGTVTSNITVQGMTFLRNCGSTSLGGLQIAGGNTTTILVNGCQFISPINSSGRGLNILSALNATVTNCIAAGTTSGGSGIGISISGVPSSVTVEGCTMTTNNGVGLYVSGAAVVAVTGSLFTGNSGANYAGANCSGSSVNLSGNTFISNWIYSSGYNPSPTCGGATCSGTTVTLSGNNFTRNSGYQGGFGTFGGAWCLSTSLITISGNSFTGNTAGNGAGGALSCMGSIWGAPAGTIIISNNIFTSNSIGVGSSGGGAYCVGTALTLSANIFTGNSSATSGGGAYCSSSATNPMSISGNTFQQNTSGSGGGIYATGQNLNLLDNLVVNNALTAGGQGAGIWVDASGTLNMINNTVTGNTSPGSGGGVAYVMTAGVELLNIYNNIIWGNSAPVNGGDVWVSGTGKQTVFDNNDVDSIYGVFSIAQNNIDLSPQFFNPIAGDYHTQSTSPCKSAGNITAPSLPATDLDGTPRVLNGLVDLGCYEFTTNVVHPADTNALFVITASEFNAYAAAWKNGQAWTNGPNPGPNPVPANYMTRAGYLMTNGGSYYNDGSSRPVNWKTNQ
jgi:hypothetical protein